MSFQSVIRSAVVAASLCAVCGTSHAKAEGNGNAASVDLSQSRLVRSLVGRSESVRLKAIASLKFKNEAKRDALDELVHALREHSNQVVAGRPIAGSTPALIQLIASVDDPAATRALVDLLDSDQMQISMFCANALGRQKCIEAIESLKQQVGRSEWKTHYGFRFNLVRALTLMDHPDAYEFLAQIRRNVDGQLLHEMNTVFQGITVDDFLGDEERFAAWKNGSTTGPSVKLAGYSESPDSIFKDATYSESANRIQLRRQKYYGIDIEAKRLVFVIDHSGSMKKGSSHNGRWGSRLWHAKDALIKAIEALPEDDEFGIIFYAETVRQWKKGLVVATPDNKQDAKAFVYRLGFGGSTNTHGALCESMNFDDDLEAVFLLTDGIPSSGAIVHPDHIVNDIVRQNQLRHLKINTIGIAVNSKTKSFLATLAKRCSGEFTQPE
ncbi:VWA domain-containing protein [Planctomycetes bacterium K23_9]|uniref:von Willebrand factor type A domain protein n=1 Tax=Stieleria marina TaxID=1930275 RepID=A0A517NZI9_9BACT|nr:von Willebrand factor type A domain protein [Planctomycetes bacterium K23_9]